MTFRFDLSRKRSDFDRVPYVLWRDQGYLTATPGDAVDVAVVEAAIREMWSSLTFRKLRLTDGQRDKRMDSLRKMVCRGGVSAKPSNLRGTYHRFEKALFEGRMIHGGNSILRWAVGNLVFIEDASGNRQPTRGGMN